MPVEAPEREGTMSTHNTWADEQITDHSAVDAEDQVVREVAENLHRNESLHRHDPSGIVCVYCALSATRAVKTMRAPDCDHCGSVPGTILDRHGARACSECYRNLMPQPA